MPRFMDYGRTTEVGFTLLSDQQLQQALARKQAASSNGGGNANGGGGVFPEITSPAGVGTAMTPIRDQLAVATQMRIPARSVSNPTVIDRVLDVGPVGNGMGYPEGSELADEAAALGEEVAVEALGLNRNGNGNGAPLCAMTVEEFAAYEAQNAANAADDAMACWKWAAAGAVAGFMISRLWRRN